MAMNILANGLLEYQPLVPLKQNILKIHLFENKKSFTHT